MTDTQTVSCDKILESGKPLPPDVALNFAIQMAQAIEEAHKSGKVFGGIFPDQVAFDPTGKFQLFELGAPRQPEDLTLRYYAFVPPELLQGERPTSQSDLFSFGVLLYLLFTGTIPFAADTIDDLRRTMLQGKVEEFPKIPGYGQVDWIIRKCLLPVGKRRFASAAEVAAELRKISRPASLLAGTDVQPTGHFVVAKPKSKAQQLQELLTDNWKTLAIAAGSLLAVVVFVMVLFSRRLPDEPRSWRVVQLTSTADTEREPTLSPDGQTVAFVSNTAANWELYLRPVAGGETTRLTESVGIESNPRWSPTGDAILFTYTGPGLAPTLFSISPGGGVPQQLAGDAIDGQWSPDGKAICYVSPAAPGKRTLYVRNLEDIQTTAVLKDQPGMAHPSFSPDSKSIVYEVDMPGSHGLATVKLKSGRTRVLTSGSNDSAPSWKWSTGSIFFVSSREGAPSIYRTDMKGRITRVTDGPNDLEPAPAAIGNSLVFWRATSTSDVIRLDPSTGLTSIVSPFPGASRFPRSVTGANSLVFLRQTGSTAVLQWKPEGASAGSTLLAGLPPETAFTVSEEIGCAYVEQPRNGRPTLWQVMLTRPSPTLMPGNLILPYEFSPDRRSLFLSVLEGNEVSYRIRDVRSQTEQELFRLPLTNRLRRAAWMDRGQNIATLTADSVLKTWSLKTRASSEILHSCLDFSAKPGAPVFAALVGHDLQHARLALFEWKGGKQAGELNRSDPDSYFATLDWSADGNGLFYDRIRSGGDLFLLQGK